jgi:hypothetical protein
MRISGLQSFHNVPLWFRPALLLSTQVAPADTSVDGSRDVYFRASQGSLPSLASDMLVVRIGLLHTAEPKAYCL